VTLELSHPIDVHFEHEPNNYLFVQRKYWNIKSGYMLESLDKPYATGIMDLLVKMHKLRLSAGKTSLEYDKYF
jgi:hypothetical protein